MDRAAGRRRSTRPRARGRRGAPPTARPRTRASPRCQSTGRAARPPLAPGGAAPGRGRLHVEDPAAEGRWRVGRAATPRRAGGRASTDATRPPRPTAPAAKETPPAPRRQRCQSRRQRQRNLSAARCAAPNSRPPPNSPNHRPPKPRPPKPRRSCTSPATPPHASPPMLPQPRRPLPPARCHPPPLAAAAAAAWVPGWVRYVSGEQEGSLHAALSPTKSRCGRRRYISRLFDGRVRLRPAGALREGQPRPGLRRRGDGEATRAGGAVRADDHR